MTKKIAVSKNTERILLRILKYMEKEPDRVHMRSWGTFYGEEDSVDGVTHENQPMPPCKTTACIGGACLLVTKAGRNFLQESGFFENKKKGYHTDFPNSFEEAMEILGLDNGRATNLFYFKGWDYFNPNAGWPKKYEKMYREAKTGKGRFKAVKLRVLFFIKTGE